MTRVAGRLLSIIEDVLAVATGVILIFVALGITTDVVGRRSLGFSIPEVIQLSEYAVFWSAFLPAAWILRENGHVSVDFLKEKFTGKRGQVLQVSVILVGLVACVVASFYSFVYVLESFRRADLFYGMMTIPRWWVFVVMPVSFSLLSAELVRKLVTQPRVAVKR